MIVHPPDTTKVFARQNLLFPTREQEEPIPPMDDFHGCRIGLFRGHRLARRPASQRLKTGGMKGASYKDIRRSTGSNSNPRSMADSVKQYGC